MSGDEPLARRANGQDEPLARRASGQADFEELLAILDLNRVDDGTFVGSHPSKNPVRTFGGQMMAQSFVAAGATLKAFPVVFGDDEMRLVVVRGDHRVNEIKLQNTLGAPFRPARSDEIAQRLGPPGYIGPVGAQMPVLLDAAIDTTAGGVYVVGANQPKAHLRGVQPGRDFPFEAVDVRTVVATARLAPNTSVFGTILTTVTA